MLSIAVELVGDPKLLCLENPVDSLDASGSIEVMSLLRKISLHGSRPTIIYVVKYLDHDMLRYVDNIALFAEHKLVKFQDISKISMSPKNLEEVKSLVVEASVQLKSYADASSTMTRRTGILGRFTTASIEHVNGVLRRIAKDIENVVLRESEDSPNLSEHRMPYSFREEFTSFSNPESPVHHNVWTDQLFGFERNDSNSTAFTTAYDRKGQDGQLFRGLKPIHIEISILIFRGWSHYFKSVRHSSHDHTYLKVFSDQTRNTGHTLSTDNM